MQSLQLLNHSCGRGGNSVAHRQLINMKTNALKGLSGSKRSEVWRMWAEAGADSSLEATWFLELVQYGSITQHVLKKRVCQRGYCVCGGAISNVFYHWWAFLFIRRTEDSASLLLRATQRPGLRLRVYLKCRDTPAKYVMPNETFCTVDV